MLSPSLDIRALQLKAQGIDPSQVVFNDALANSNPLDHLHVPTLDSSLSTDQDQCIDIHSGSQSDCSVLTGTTIGLQMNSPSKKLKAETQTLPAELSPSPMSPATTAPVSCSSSSLSSSPSLACTRPSPISVNSDSRTSDRSVIEILSEAEAEDESDSNDDKKPIAKSPNYYKFNARIREEDHTEEQEEGVIEILSESEEEEVHDHYSISRIDLCTKSTVVEQFESLETSSIIDDLRNNPHRALNDKTSLSGCMEKIVSTRDIDLSFMSPLLAKYKKTIATVNKEFTLNEKKEACRKNEPKFIEKNQEKKDHNEACRKRREKYHCSDYKDMKRKMQAMDRARKRDMRSKFTKTDVNKEKINKESSLRRERKKEAHLLNGLFPFDKSKFPVEWRKRPPKSTGTKENNRTYLMYPERMATVFKGTKGSFRDSQGKVTREGMTMSITTNSFVKVMFMLLKKLDIKKGRNMITLDLGSGQGIPSILMSQFFGDGPSGLHIGIEQDQGLVASSRYNAKLVATKALVNFHRGYFEKEYIEMHGETVETCFPNTLFVHGDICQISSLKPFDVLYGFDAANSTESKKHIAKLWNQANPGTRNLHGMSQCPNPKHLLSNSNMQEILDLGFQDILPYSQVEVRFSGSTETRKTYHYVRESLLKQGKNNQTYSYENPLPLGEVCPIFQSAWKDYLAGRRQMEDTNSHVCNRAILDRLLSEEYYQETLPKRSDRVRHKRSMNVANLEAAAWDREKPVEVVDADDSGTRFSNMSSISE